MGAKYSKLSKKEKKEISDEYGISISTIDEMMKNFSANCDANGAISKGGFCKLVSQSMSKELAERVFDSFDKDHNGVMDPREYILMMGLTHGGTLDQKLKASFRMFDSDGNGSLSSEELKEMFILIFNQRRQKNPNEPLEPIDENRLQAIDRVVNLVFSKIDKDGNGEISYDEFIEGYKKHNDICSFFKQI